MKIYAIRLLLVTILIFISSLFSFSQENVIRDGKLSEGLQAFAENGKMGFKNANGKIVLKPKFQLDPFNKLPFFNEGLCMFFEIDNENNQKIGFINKSFEIAIPAKFPTAGLYCDNLHTYFKNGFAVVNDPASEDNSEYIIINKKGDKVGNTFKYNLSITDLCLFHPVISSGLVAAMKNDKYGFINVSNGKFAIEAKYNKVYPFSEGIAAVEVDKKYIILIDSLGNQIGGKKFYTQKQNSKKVKDVSEHKNPDYTNQDFYSVGFVKGRMILFFYDKNGMGDFIVGLLDKRGNVVRKISNFVNADFGKSFQKYKWENKPD
jgi:hypothetical protein